MALLKVELIGSLSIGLVERNPRHFQIEFVHLGNAPAHENFTRLRRALMSGQAFDLEFRPQNFLGAGLDLKNPLGRR